MRKIYLFVILLLSSYALQAQVTAPLCSGGTSSTYTNTDFGDAGGTLYSWAAPSVPGISGTTAGVLQAVFSAQTLTNSTTSPIAVVYTLTMVTPPFSRTVTITVNPTPTVNAIANPAATCAGTLTPLVTFSGAVTSTTYNWTNNIPAIGLAATGSGNITPFTAANVTSVQVFANIIVTPVSNSCTGTSQTFTYTINPIPTLNLTLDQVLCTAAATTPATFTSTVASTIFNWTNNNTGIGLGGSGAGNIASFTTTNVSNLPITGFIQVTPVSNTCNGVAQTFSITVKPLPTVGVIAPQTLCNGTLTTAVNFIGLVGNTTYDWTNSSSTIGLAFPTGSGDIAAFTAANLSNIPLSAIVTVIPSSNSCSGTPLTFTITVNPTPDITSGITDLAFCNGVSTTAVIFSSAVSGTDYAWTSNITAIGIAAAGSTTIPSFAAGISGFGAISALITVVPVSNTCTGTPQSFSITINPTPNILTGIVDQVRCNGVITSSVSFTNSVPGTIYSWSTPTSIGLPLAGTGTINAFTPTNGTPAPITAIITVTPVSNTCSGTPQTFSYTINPTPTVNTLVDQVICNNSAVTVASFGGFVPSTNYDWISTTAAIGIAALTGTGDILPFSSTNITPVPLTAIITVTPSSNTCIGSPTVFSITVNPVATVNALSDVTACNNTLVNLVNFSSPLGGTTYSWINNNPSIGIGVASGTGDITNFTATASVTPAADYIIVTPVYLGCNGTPTSFTVTINPTPSVSPIIDQTVCTAATLSIASFGGSVASTTYDWVSTTTSVGIVALTGTGDIISFSATNISTVPVTAYITVTPSSNTCIGSNLVFSLTVNPVATINPLSDITACSGLTITPAAFVSPVSGTTYSWTNTDPTTGLPASGIGAIIPFTASSLGVPATGIITVIPTANSCAGTQFTYTISINPTPTINAITSQSVCSGVTVTIATFNGFVPTAAFSWSSTTAAIGLSGLTGTGNTIANFTASNPTLLPVTAFITVSAVSNTCAGIPVVFSITVAPLATLNAFSNQSLCSGIVPAQLSLAAFTSAISSTTYTWQNSNPSTGLPAGPTAGNIITFTPITSGVPEVGIITVQPSAFGCNGAQFTFTITVNPTPSISTGSIDQIICNGLTTTAASFTGPISNTTYNWTNNTTSIGLAASGSGTINPFAAINTFTVPVIALIQVTPVSNTCSGTPYSFSYTVNPTPAILTGITDQSLCNGVLTTGIAFTGPMTGTLYGWTNNTTSIGLLSAGTGTINAFTATNSILVPVTALIIVTPVSNACNGAPQTFSITVNPTPDFTSLAIDQVLCNGVLTANVAFTGNVTSTIYNWTNNLTSIGLAAAGSGTINAFNAINTFTVPVYANVIITPFSNSCNGIPQQFTFTVNPSPTITSGAVNQAVCNGVLTTAISFTGALSGTAYGWTNTTTSIGLAASGTGTINAFTVTNGTPVPVIATITVTPFSNGCNGTSQPFSIIANPTPSVLAITSPISICTGLLTATIPFTGTVASTNFNWVNSNAATGLTALSSTGDITPFIATNTLPVPINSSVIVTPVSNSCSGSSIAFSIIVNPIPTVNTITSQSICNTFSTTAVTFTGFVGSTSYQWTNSTVAVGLAPLTGTGNIGAFVGTNPGGVPISTSISVTPFSNSCAGTPIAFSIVVNPTPTVSNAFASPIVMCSGTVTSAITFTGNVTPAIYQWSHTNIGTGLTPLSSTGNIAAFTATNVTGVPISTLVTVIPVSNSCIGAAVSFSYVVNSIPTVNTITSQAICNTLSTAAVIFSGLVPGTTYQWANTNTAVGLASFTGTGNIASFTGTNGGAVPISTQITVLPVSACTGSPISFTITVNPTPTVSSLTASSQILCNGVLTNLVTPAAGGTNVLGTIYGWSSSITTIGISTGSGPINPFTATNTLGVPISALVTVTPVSNSCSGTPTAYTLTINPTPSVSMVGDVAICNGFTATVATFTGSPVASTQYGWLLTGSPVGITSTSPGSITPFIGTNATAFPISATITVMPVSNSCNGTPIAFTITVNPTPVLNSSLTSTVCNGAAFSYSATTLTPNTAFTWNRAANAAINGNTSNSGISTISESLINNNNTTAVNAVYAFTLTANSCINSQNVTVTVNPTAVLTSTLTPSPICAATIFTYSPTFSAPGASLTWTRTLATGLSSGGPVSGTGSIAQTINNSTTAPGIATYAYIVAVSNCTNPTPFSVTLNVNPIPVLNSATTFAPICSGSAFSYQANSATVGATFSWNKPAVTGITTTVALTGTINPIFHVFNNTNTTLTDVVYQYTISANTCVNQQTVTIGVYPVGSLNSTLAPAPVCSNTVFSYSPTSITGGITFNWSRPIVAGITNTAGSGVNDPSEILFNSTPGPVNVIYNYNIITAAGCTNAQTIVATINPRPTLSSSLTPAAICTGALFNYVPTSGTVSTTFNWSRPAVTGISNGAATGFNNPAEVLTNPTINPVAVIYNFTLTSNSCVNNQPVTVFVNPIPIVGAQSATICSNSTFTITPANVPAATLYTWGAPTVTPAGSTLGANLQSTGVTPISQFLNNQTVNATTVIYYVVPTATGCNGNTFTVTITVSPTPVVGAQTMTAVCSGTPFNFAATGVPTGTSYTWAAPSAVPSGSLTGGTAQPLTQPSVNQTLVSTNNLMDTAIYSVTPATILCIGNPFLLTVPVKPVPVISNLRDTICSGNTFVLNPTPVPANTTFTWTAPAVSPSGAIAGGSAQTVPTTGISQTLTNNSAAYAQATYTVTPSALNCAGAPFLLIETVNRAIPVFAAQNALICSGTAFNATPSNTPAGTTFTWPVPANTPPVGITGTSAALLPVTTVSQVLSNNNNAVDTAIYAVTPSINNCPGVAFAANIRVMPLPKATISGPASVCANVLIDTVSLAFNGTAPWTFTFSDGITTNTRTGIASSPYKLTLPAMAKNISKRVITVMNVKDATCSNTIDSSFFTQIINPLPVGKIISLHGNYLCNGIKDTLFVQSPDSLGYQWKLNTVNITGATTDSIATTSAGSYNAMLTNAFGCSDTAALPVTLYLVKPPVLKLSIDTSCVNSITTFKNLTDTTFTGAVQWLWNFGNGKTATAMDGVTTYPAAGNYHVSLKATQLSCTAYPPVTLDTSVNIQFPIPGITLPSVSASKGTPTPVDSRSIPGYKYQWTPSAGIQTPDSPSTVFNFSATQQYIIKLISQAGCVTNDTLLVRVFDAEVKEIFVPKTFTPNGDGVNDKLYPYIAGVKQFHYFRILNRFGKLLFETKTPDTGWDGTLNGVQQPMSIYFWFAEGVLEDGTVVQKSGQVLLIR